MYADRTDLKSFFFFRTGVVTTEDADAAPWLELVELAWKEVASKKEITDVSFMFVPIKRRTEFTMDMLIEGNSHYQLWLTKSNCVFTVL